MGVVAFLLTQKLGMAIGAALLVLAEFPGGQATHLAQENHQDTDTTPIEKFFQKKRKLSYLISLLIAILSLVIMSISLN